MTRRKKPQSSHDQLMEWIKVSSKGQISIPAEIRRALGIKTGSRLLIIMRKDKEGFNLIREEVLNKTFKKFST